MQQMGLQGAVRGKPVKTTISNPAAGLSVGRARIAISSNTASGLIKDIIPFL